MVSYIQFQTEDDSVILVEVQDVEDTSGLQKTGLGQTAQAVIATAQTTIENALKNAIKVNAQSLLKGIQSLPEQPIQVELAFGLKATGEVGNMAVCKAVGEATYSVKLVWQPKKPDNGVVQST